MAAQPKSEPCPCGGPAPYAECCGRYHGGEPAPDAERLMRSRYTAFVRGDEAYLQATWHPSTRPEKLSLSEEAPTKWLGLEIKGHRPGPGDDRAVVEFVARYKVGGRAFRLHETSRFVREDGRWYYVDGDIH